MTGLLYLFFRRQLTIDPARAVEIAKLDAARDLRNSRYVKRIFFLGLFVMVGGLEERGIIAEVAELLAGATEGSRAAEGLAVLWGAAAGSAAVDNIPFTAVMIPVIDELQADGRGFDDGLWWSLALRACFGGNATMIAAAVNVAATGVLDRGGHRVTFGRFLAVGLPVTLVWLAVSTAYLLLFQL